MKPVISQDAWELIESVLGEHKDPSPDREHWDLVAEQERKRCLAILSHRVTLFGRANDTDSN